MSNAYLAAVGAYLLGIPCIERQLEQEEQSVRIAGTLQVEDTDGLTATSESGWAIARVTAQNDGALETKSIRVLIKDGHFEIMVHPEARITFDVFEIDDRQAFLVAPLHVGRSLPGNDDPVGLPIPTNREFQLRARFARPLLLHVVDESGNELNDVDVLNYVMDEDVSDVAPENTLEFRTRIMPEHAHAADYRVRSRESPIQLRVAAQIPNAAKWRALVWVHAPHRIWKAVVVDYRQGGAQFVRLARAGQLSVTVAGARVPAGAMVVVQGFRNAEGSGDNHVGGETNRIPNEEVPTQISTADEVVLAKQPVVTLATPIVFDGVPFGTYHVSIEVGSAVGAGRVRIADRRVEVLDGKQANVELRCTEEVKAPEGVPLLVRLQLDSGWGAEPFAVEVIPIVVSPLSSQDDLRWPRAKLVRIVDSQEMWETPQVRVVPGKYLLLIKKFHFIREFTAAKNSQPVSIVIGAPVDICVRVVDKSSGTPLIATDVVWYSGEPQDHDLEVAAPLFVGPSMSGSKILARVPKGRIRLTGHCTDYVWDESIRIEVSEVGDDIEVQLEHETGIRVSFFENGNRVAWEGVFPWTFVEASGGQYVESPDPRDIVVIRLVGSDSAVRGGVGGEEWPGAGRTFLVPEGEFHVAFAPPAGYLSIPMKKVTVVQGKIAELAVEVARVR